MALPFALLPVPLLLAAVLWVDRLEPEPRGNLVAAFAWGAGVAALLALLINTAGLEYLTQPALGTGTGEYVSATFGAPLVEETLKGLILLGLLWRRRAEFDGPTDGIIYASMALLGILVSDRRRLVRLILIHLPAYAPTGLVGAGEIAMLASLQARHRARVRARARAGLSAGLVMGDYQLAATELALLRAKAEAGIVTGVPFARRERDLIGLMRAARDSLPR